MYTYAQGTVTYYRICLLYAVYNYYNPYFFFGDGSKGVPAKAPYNKIIVTAGAPVVPKALTDQLAEGGILIIPVGDREKQMMLRIRKKDGNLIKEEFANFAFVPLLGEQGWKK